MKSKRFAEAIVEHKKEVADLTEAKEKAEKLVEQLKAALQAAETKKVEEYTFFPCFLSSFHSYGLF